MFDNHYGLEDAVLNGTKTMTRRFIPTEETEGGLVPVSFWNGKWCGAHGKPLKKQPYKVGERLAIAQRYSELSWDESFYNMLKSKCELLPQYELKGWDNKMFVKAEYMPHQIEITDVKVERIQDIVWKDCLREGVLKAYIGYYVPGIKCKDWENESHVDTEDFKTWKLFPTPEEAFAALIKKIGGKKAWEDNPWVFAYSIKLIK